MLRLIHTLGGCGGTLLSRCIAVLPQVALLSEVNPASVKLFPEFDPLYQDQTWLHLLTATDMEHFSQLDLREAANFRDLIQVFHDRASDSGRHLVIRDYNYVEFIGTPFQTDPPGRLMLYEALPPAIPTAALALIRHPVDQWHSLSKHLDHTSGLDPRTLMDAYETFLRELGATPVFKYEDFIDNPEDQLRAIASALRLPFEPSFRERFHQFDGVTGDFARLHDQSISPPARKLAPADVMEKFRSSPSFRAVLEKTGYSDSI